MHAWGTLWPWQWTKDKRAPDRLIHWLRALVDGGVLTKDQIRKILDYLIVKLVSRQHATHSRPVLIESVWVTCLLCRWQGLHCQVTGCM